MFSLANYTYIKHLITVNNSKQSVRPQIFKWNFVVCDEIIKFTNKKYQCTYTRNIDIYKIKLLAIFMVWVL